MDDDEDNIRWLTLVPEWVMVPLAKMRNGRKEPGFDDGLPTSPHTCLVFSMVWRLVAAPATGVLGCAAPGSSCCLRICPNIPSYCRVVALAAKEVAKPTWPHTAHCAAEGAEDS